MCVVTVNKMSLQCVCSLMVLVMVVCCGYGLKVDRYNCTIPNSRLPLSDSGVCNVTGLGSGRELRCASTSTKTPLLSDGNDTTYYAWTTSTFNFLSLAIPNNVCVGAIVMTFSTGTNRGIPSLTFEPNEPVTTSQDVRPGNLVNTTINFTPQYCGQSVRINMEKDGKNAIQLTEVTLIEGGPSPSAVLPPVPTRSAPGATASNTAQVLSSNTAHMTPSPSVVPSGPQDGDITVPVVVAIIAILLTVLLVVLATVCVCVLVHKKTQWKPAVLYTSSVRFRNSFRRKSAFTDDQEFVMNKQSPQPEIIVLRNCKDDDDNDSCKSGPKDYKENYAAIGPSESIHHDVAAVVNNNNQQQQEQQEQQQQQQQQEGDLNRSSSQESIHSRDVPAKMMYGKVTWVHTNMLDHPYDDCGEGESHSQPQHHHSHYEEPEKPCEVQQTLNDRVIPVSPEASSSPTTVDSTDNEKVSLVKPCENDTYEVPPDTLVNDRVVPLEQNAIVTNESSTYDVPPDALINDRVAPTETSVSGLNEASVYDVPPDLDGEVDQTPLPTEDQGDTYDLPPDCLESNTYEAPDSLPPKTTHTAPPSREGKGRGKKWFSWRKGKKEKMPKFSENTYEVPPDCQETKKKEKNKKTKRPLKRKERKSPPLPDVPLGAGGSGSHAPPLDEQLPSQSAIYESPDSMVPRVLGVGGDTYAKLNECTPTEETAGTPKPGQNHTTFQVEDEHTYSAVVKPPKSTTSNLPSSTQAPLSASPLSPPPLPSSPHQEPVYSQVDKENKKLTTYNSMTDAFDEEFWGGSVNSGEDQATCEDPVEKTDEGKTPVQDSTYTMVDYSKKKHRPKK